MQYRSIIEWKVDIDWLTNNLNLIERIYNVHSSVKTKHATFDALGGISLKPIFHQNAKYLALGTFALGNAKSSTFALADARNTNMLVSFALGDTNFLRWPCTFHFFCVYFICVG